MAWWLGISGPTCDDAGSSAQAIAHQSAAAVTAAGRTSCAMRSGTTTLNESAAAVTAAGAIPKIPC